MAFGHGITWSLTGPNGKSYSGGVIVPPSGKLDEYNKEGAGKVLDKAFEELDRRAEERKGADQFRVFMCLQKHVLSKNGMERFNLDERARGFMKSHPRGEGEKSKVGEVLRVVDKHDAAHFDANLPGLGK